MSRELILAIAAGLFVLIAIYAINIISKLNLAKGQKWMLYWVTVIIPVLGLFLALRSRAKQ